MIEDKQIQQIIDEVEKSSIESEELKDDLVDHFCCLIETDIKKECRLMKRINEPIHRLALTG